MAQTEIIRTNIPLYKPTNSRTPLEVGDTLKVILNSDLNPPDYFSDDAAAYQTVDLTLTYVDNLRHEYGWDRAAVGQDYRSLDIDRAHDQHSPECS